MRQKLKTDPIFDWYSATLRETTHERLEEVLFYDFQRKSVRGIMGYSRGLLYSDDDFISSVAVYSGRNPGLHIIFTGCNAFRMVPTLRDFFPIHTVSRVDSAFDLTSLGDTYNPSLYNELRRIAQFQTNNKMTGKEIIPSRSSMGRTYYLGSPKSRAMIRIYEKGLEQIGKFGDEAGIDKNWVRIELQLRPEGAQKAWTSQASPLECWNFSKHTMTFIQECFPLISRFGLSSPPTLTAREFSDTQKIENLGKAHFKLFKDYSKRTSFRYLVQTLEIGYRKRHDLVEKKPF